MTFVADSRLTSERPQPSRANEGEEKMASMIKCPTCSGDMPGDKIVCPSCGASVNSSLMPTRLQEDDLERLAPTRHAPPPRQRASTPFSTASHSSLDGARFIPGTMLDGRYRIVGLLGKGGMGEVYRADDLKLGQTVALKFLPEAIAADGATLARFHREVRIARQISHPNVCRVFDIGETEGQHFLSMEYIDGEDLSMLLRRIGRLPPDKALEIARQLCAGLSAAHDNGVLHRDLKPANVMIDGRGRARITDFGLAGLSEEFRPDELRAGTPAYMAPEQLKSGQVTVKSDLYALGLVLYELFTGKPAFEASTLPELLALHEKSTPTSPSSHVRELDPLIERVIMRCLERDPSARPASALQVAASLPGGDPLAAALAAGETPSPEMVAAAPKLGSLSHARAAALAVSVLVVLALTCYVTKQTALYRLVPLPKSPEVLQERAREINRRLGYTQAPLDQAFGSYIDRFYLRHVLENESSPARWDKLSTGQPAAIYYWHRQSPRPLDTQSSQYVRYELPPLDVSGMTNVMLDPEGNLRQFIAVAPQREEPLKEAPPAFDWSLLLREAGFNPADFQPVESTWVPPRPSDTRAAFDGFYPKQPQIKVHVEAASYRGLPVYFEVINPWDSPDRQEAPLPSSGDRLLIALIMAVFLLVLFGGALLAFRNLRLGRGDRRGAFRLALFLFTALLVAWVFDSHHVTGFGEFLFFVHNLQYILFQACFVWFMYIALEPLMRRRWPNRIISWTRLLAGDFRDPLVGRDILIGALLGSGLALNNLLVNFVPQWLGWPQGVPHFDDQRLLGIRYVTSGFVSLFSASFWSSFVYMFLLLLLAIVLRRDRLGVAAFWLIIFLALCLGLNEKGTLSPLFAAGGATIMTVGLYRFGLLTTMASMFFFHCWVSLPITTELSAWYAGDFTPALVFYVALVVCAFYTSLGGQPLFRGGFLEE
ncbi:MAG TPA: serine/threonine-protein kinase [Pyrinomonadaceae bacterium]